MADSNTVTTAVLINVTGNLTGNATSPSAVQVVKVISWLTFSIGLPAIALAIYTLKKLSKGLYSFNYLLPHTCENQLQWDEGVLGGLHSIWASLAQVHLEAQLQFQLDLA